MASESFLLVLSFLFLSLSPLSSSFSIILHLFRSRMRNESVRPITKTVSACFYQWQYLFDHKDKIDIYRRVF